MSQVLFGALHINYSGLDQGFAQIENRVLNKCGYVPVFGTFFGVARMVIGIIQIIMAVVIPIFNLIRGSLADRVQQGELITDGAKAFPYAQHGVANFIRGQAEVIPVLGGLFCALYDYVGRWRIHYEEEECPNRVSPMYLWRRPSMTHLQA